MDTTPRLSTREAAARLRCTEPEARILLRIARVPEVRVGRAFLWDGAAVASLARTLRRRVAGGAYAQTPRADGRVS
jgi:hypothetical protein